MFNSNRGGYSALCELFLGKRYLSQPSEYPESPFLQSEPFCERNKIAQTTEDRLIANSYQHAHRLVSLIEDTPAFIGANEN